MTCEPKDWSFARGAKALFTCILDERDCSGGKLVNTTDFQKDNSAYCSVTTQSCYSSPQTNYRLGCWCEKTSGSPDYLVTYKYAFYLDPNAHNGSWTCSRSCDPGKVGETPYPLPTTVDEACTNFVGGRFTPVRLLPKLVTLLIKRRTMKASKREPTLNYDTIIMLQY
jgi:hypothetical protein